MKKLIYYIGPLLLGLMITILFSLFSTSNAHTKGQTILLFKEIQTFLTIGFVWYAPFLFFLWKDKKLNGLKRVFIYLTSLILCIVYYRILTSHPNASEDTRLVAGYIYKHEYYLDVGMGVFLSILLSGIFIEVTKRLKKNISN